MIYQISWIRQFRAIFGVSTQASAVVMAMFLGGLGLGARYIGKRTDSWEKSPVHLYGLLELGIAASTLLSLGTLHLARFSYIELGGIEGLGAFGATCLRLFLAALIIGPPTFLMGGTLPAMTRAVTGAGDPHRLQLGLLYGANTLGAFSGGLLAAFYLHEHLGVHWTLILAVGFNLVVALVAIGLGHRKPFLRPAAATSGAEAAVAGNAPSSFVLVAVTLTGLLFLLMELVWYRMLSPLLGGSTYTISLILCGALLGVGLGGALYPLIWRRRVPSLQAFAITCALEGLLLGLPLALGDRLAVWTAGLGGAGFGAMVFGWLQVIMLVVFPASLMAGIQFPLLIALLGRAHTRLGRQIGLATLLNSGGAILGSLAGGFGLMILLSATGVWRLVIALCLVLSVWSWVLYLKGGGRPDRKGLLLLLPLACLPFVAGPGAPWRHSGIGVGRSGLQPGAHPNQVKDWLNVNRRQIVWERDGIESTIGISDLDGVAFIVNGKTDGNAVGDAGTQVMSGLVGAALHAKPQSALVVGLGTGSTAGWLGSLGSMKRVDVVELEPAVLETARRCGPVNEDALDNEKVHIILGDAREFLLTTDQRYDLIFSEPSNPYRAGISSMYTREYYGDAARRLRDDGLFLQWFQGYSVDEQTVARVYSTLSSVFSSVETWVTGNRDLILVASQKPLVHDVARLRRRLSEEPFARAMHAAWRVAGLEGFLSRYYANEQYTAAMAVFPEDQVNSDDRPYIEFAMARSVGRGLFDPYEAWKAMPEAQRRPNLIGEEAINWVAVDEAKINLMPKGLPVHKWWFPKEEPWTAAAARMRALMIYYSLERADKTYPGKLAEAMSTWEQQSEPPRMRDAWLLHGEWAAYNGRDLELAGATEKVAAINEAEAAILRAMYFANKNPREAAQHLLLAFKAHRTDPWPRRSLLDAALQLTPWVANQDAAAANDLFKVLSEPFAVASQNYKRRVVLTYLADIRDYPSDCGQAFEPLEPHVPWEETFLEGRVKCYEALGLPELARAKKELAQFRKAALRLH